MVGIFQKHERLGTVSETGTYSLHSYCSRINLFATFPSHFQCCSLLKVLVLMWVVKSMISY